jgi:hypothetical protein
MLTAELLTDTGGFLMAFTLPTYHPPDFGEPPLKDAPLVRFAPVVQPGVAPENYHVTSIFPEYYQLAQGRWVLLAHSRMDCVVVREPEGRLVVKEFHHLEAGEQVALGRGENGEEGIFVHTGAFAGPPGVTEKFAFRTRFSRETSFSIAYDELHELLSYERDNGFILWVVGPAAVFDYDARKALTSLISGGYVQGFWPAMPWRCMISKPRSTRPRWARRSMASGRSTWDITITWTPSTRCAGLVP